VWLLIEWPKGETEPTKYRLSTLPQNIAFADLVDAAKLRAKRERSGSAAPSRKRCSPSRAAAVKDGRSLAATRRARH